MPPYQDHDPESNDDSPPSSLSTQLDRSTVRKLDFVLLPFLSLLFLVNSLDRSNIGNAETAHFTRDTGLHPSDLNLAVAFFYAFFVILQPVGAAVGRTFGMSRYVPVAMTLWGFCTMLHIWISSKWQLVVLRSIIGALEGRSPLGVLEIITDVRQPGFTQPPSHTCHCSTHASSLAGDWACFMGRQV